MSFSFQFFGDKAVVAQKVADYKVSGDTSQVEAIKAMVADIVNGSPDETVVFVEGSGHHDYSDPTRPYANIQFKLVVKSKESAY